MGKLWRRLRALVNRRRIERELEEDMAAHRDMMGSDRRRDFGNTLRLREEVNDVWGWTWLDQLRQDLFYGARSLARSPGFSLTAIAVLALGIGVNLAECHLFNGFLRRIRARDPESLCQFFRVTKQGTSIPLPLSSIEFYARHNTVLSAVVTEIDVQGVTDTQDTTNFRCVLVSGNYFGEAGIAPLYGRLLDAQDDQPGADAVAVLGYAYWQSHYGADPGIVLRTIRLNDKPVRVVGIAPMEFGGILRQTTSVWLADVQYGYLTGNSGPRPDYSAMVGRMKSGVSLERVEAQFRTLTAALRSEQPLSVQQGEWLAVRQAGSGPGYDSKAVLVVGTFVLLVLLVLVSSCANLGNMLLARGLARQREIDIRLSIGAGRFRLIRQLMTENFLLAVLASVAALGVGKVAARILFWITDAPPFMRAVTDWRIVSACAALGLLAMLGFGLAPAFQTIRRGRSSSGTRRVLVAVQVAVSCVLLILSSFLIRMIQRSYNADTTFDVGAMATVYPDFYFHHYTAAQSRQAADEMAGRLRAVPGIDGVTIALIPPTARRSWIEHAGPQELYLNAVDAAYFDVMRAPLVTGRIFGPGDPDGTVVSESAARKLWPNQSPLGKTLRIRKRDRVVIGVVKDSGANFFNYAESVEAYVPVDDESAPYLTFLVHATRNPAEMAAVLHAAVARPDLAPRVATFPSEIAQRTDTIRKMVAIIASLGGIATCLAMIGIFGLLAFTVTQRTREIGVRMALGARGADILRCVLGQYAVPFSVGAAAGLVLAAAAVRVVGAILFGAKPLDLLSYGGGLLAFAAVAVVAAIAPARRALKIDAASALRWE